MAGVYDIAHGDVLTCLRELPDNEFDALLADPPYGFSFMGHKWDYDVPPVDVWREALRVLKPGAPILVFGGTRTFHRMATNIEDAGFELRDCLMWLYGKGFPKSHNISLAIDKAAGAERPVLGTRTFTGNAAVSLKDKGGTYGVQVGTATKTVNVTGPATELAQAWNGYGTALKPAWEPCILARKPLAGTMVENVEVWGCGGLAIDACRIGVHDCTPEEFAAKAKTRTAPNTYGEHKGGGSEMRGGRWPANLILDEDTAALLDASTAPTKSVPYPEHSADGAVLPLKKRAAGGYSDAGGLSRFYYCAKVATKERERGCESLPLRSAGEVTGGREEGSVGLDNPRAGAGRTGGARNHHPTLKPIALTRWLASLIKPPASYDGAQLLVPYSGAGSEMIGALLAGWPIVLGIEGSAEYIDIARARIPAWIVEPAD